MRLHELTQEQLLRWRFARARAGRDKYGDAHLQRNGPVDIMEELLDIENIFDLHYDKIEDAGYLTDPVWECLYNLRRAIRNAKGALMDLDKRLPDHLCTDEQGGERVWWSRQSRMESGEPKRCLGCGRIISDDEAYDRCFPCRVQDEQEGGAMR